MKKKLFFTFHLITLGFIHYLYAQSDVAGGSGHTGTNTAWYVGWDISTTFPLDIRHEGPYPINFYTDFLGSGTTPRMIIDGTSGNIGMGVPPSGLKLNVDNDINLNTSVKGHGYNIGGELLLSAPGIENVFLGVDAGLNTSIPNATKNTFIGHSAGYNSTFGDENTFVGNKAGYSHTYSYGATFIGASAGLSQVTGSANTYIGHHACELGGTSFTEHNTLTGNGAGRFNLGNKNSFYGSLSGLLNTTGSNNCFFGMSSGTSMTTGSKNSFFGTLSGLGISTGSRNTLMGAYAVYAYFPNGDDNTILGSYSMYQMNGGYRNTTVGARTGYGFETGDDNTFVGYQSGQINAGGNLNTFVGQNSGIGNTTGYNNTFLGATSGGSNSSGYLNTFIGYGSGTPSTNLTNASSIGASSIVRNNNHMILGNNSVNVGIGLSNDATGPRAKLEINDGTTGVSGLQFRTLTSAYNPGSTATKFLTVDVDGKVILKDVPGSGGSVAACAGPLYLNKLSKWTGVGSIPELCNSLVYDDGTNVGVNNTSPTHQVDITGDLGISAPLYYSGARTIARDGTDNFYVGNNAGNTSTPNVAYGNTAVGASSLRLLTNSAAANTSLGFQSGYNVTTGGANTLLGYRAGFNNSTGTNNIAIGTDAASNGGSGVSLGSNNVIVGDYSGQNEEGDQNTFIGNYSGQTHENGDLNLFAGYNANIYPGGSTTDTYENCVLLGQSSFVYNGTGTSTISNATAIGSNAIVGCEDCIVLGSISAFSHPNTRTLMGYYDIPASLGFDYRLYVNGMPGGRSAYFNGNAYCTGLFISSDANIKTSINNIDPETASDIIDNLEPKTYYFDTIANPRLNLPSGLQYGLLAQEVETILPSLVENQTAPATKDSNLNVIEPEINFKSINYIALVPILLQELKNAKRND